MTHPSAKWFLLAAATALVAVFWSTSTDRDQNDKPRSEPVAAKSVRPAWTTSRVVGSPEPPPPYKTERVFENISFKNPTVITMAPGSKCLFVCEQAGKIFSFPEDLAAEKAELCIDLKKQIRTIPPESNISTVGELYGLAFHPQFEQNRFCYVCYTLNSKTRDEQLPDGTRVSRFVVTDSDPPTIDPDSEKVLITWLGGGHNGGCLIFGPEGYLYISSGDGSFPNPPDARLAGQDVSNLLSAVLRIDVDHEAEGRAYRIPDDNPFVHLAGARGEIWAYGFRNPWKISFDRATGDLWLGDVGWESFELVDRIVKGGNYGWSITEGVQPVRPDAKRGPTPILPPTIPLPHSEAASVTGGYVYRGEKLPGLVGKYIFGDWETRRMWAATWDGEKVTERIDIVEPAVRVVAFGENHSGELYFMDYDAGTIHQLAKNDAANVVGGENFPRKLSHSGLFASVPEQRPADGVVPFEVNCEMWADGATAQRWIAVPGDGSIQWHMEPVPVTGSMFSRNLIFPDNTVVAKTLSLENERGKSETRRHIETQLLHFDGKRWRAYSYRWNDEQTDADLVGAEGEQSLIQILDGRAPGGRRELTWSFHGRAACARCHNPWAQYTLAFNVPQLNRKCSQIVVPPSGRSETAPDGGTTDQLTWLSRTGLIETRDTFDPANLPSLATPHDASKSLDARARAYLQANCAHCHQFGGSGTSDIELRIEKTIDQTKTLDVRPRQGAFQIEEAQIIAPGDPFRSVLFYRVANEGKGHMPIIGSETVDDAGVQLLADWIRSLPPRSEEVILLARLRDLDESSFAAKEREAEVSRIERIARDLAGKEERTEPTDTDRAKARETDRKQSAQRTADRAKERQETIAKLLSTPSRALMLSRTLVEQPLSDAMQQEVLAAAFQHADEQVKDLFERFRPSDQRPKRLGTHVRPEKLLALTGDATRGRELFFRTSGMSCKSCHKIGDEGGSVGPELTQIGKKYDKAKLLESLLEPSKFIDPRFVAYLAQTDDGKVVSGLLIEQTVEHVILRNPQGQDVRLLMPQVEVLLPRQSLMPELLLKDLTAEQVADLLAFLESLRRPPDKTPHGWLVFQM